MNGSIDLFTGLLGGGKTLLAVEEIAYHIRRGGTVYTNIALKLDGLRAWMAEHGLDLDESRIHILKVEDIEEFHKHVARGTKDMASLVVIDEASLNLNARDWQKLNRDLWNFNVLVRKLDIRLIYISQQPEYLDKQIRGLVREQVDCRNLRNFYLGGILPIPIPLLIRVYARKGFGGKAMRSHAEFCPAPRWVYPLYDSDALLGKAAGQFSDMPFVNTAPLKKIPRVERPTDAYACLLAFCAALVLMV